jgi:3-hydroxy acid dehydrogenase / malonic semialdehyde reductase
MNRIQGKLAIVTGASAGIGEACARELARRGADLILLARRGERLDELQHELHAEFGVNVRTRVFDVRVRAQSEALRDEMVAVGITPDILINNAGLARGMATLHEGDPDDWDEMIDTNVKGLLYVSRAILPLMVERNSGHVINIGSIAGRWVYPQGNVYNATKFAVYALNEGMNVDLAGTQVRVTSIDPGAVETEFSKVRFHGDEERADTVYKGYTPLSAEDVADSVCYALNVPEHWYVHQMMIMCTDQRGTVFNKKTD